MVVCKEQDLHVSGLVVCKEQDLHVSGHGCL